MTTKNIIKLGTIGTLGIIGIYISIIFIYNGIARISAFNMIPPEESIFIITVTIVLFRFWVGVIRYFKPSFEDEAEMLQQELDNV